MGGISIDSHAGPVWVGVVGALLGSQDCGRVDCGLGCSCSWLLRLCVVVRGVGVVVWELHSGREHLCFCVCAKRLSFCVLVACICCGCKCLRAHGGCLGSRSR